MNPSTPVTLSFFLQGPLKLLDEHERWRRVGQIFKLSREARLRLEWIIAYHEGKTGTEIARRYGIARKTFYKWYAFFDADNLYSLHHLEDQSKAPKHVRQREFTPLQESRILALRRRYIRYGKEKIARLCQEAYHEAISSWKVQKVIEAWQLYYHPAKAARTRAKKKHPKKRRITELTPAWYQKKAGYILCLDAITFHWNVLKHYVFTAVDKYGKVAYARMYSTKSSQNGEDFLLRLCFLLDGQLPRVGHDNGSEFESTFGKPAENSRLSSTTHGYEHRKTIPRTNASIALFRKSSLTSGTSTSTQPSSTRNSPIGSLSTISRDPIKPSSTRPL